MILTQCAYCGSGQYEYRSKKNYNENCPDEWECGDCGAILVKEKYGLIHSLKELWRKIRPLSQMKEDE